MSTARFRTLSPAAKTYIICVVAVGAATVVHSVYQLYAQPIGWEWTIFAILTLLSGSATVRLPSLPATISISETFVFTSTLLFGPAPGTLTVALDAFVISVWSYRRGHPAFKVVFNVCALPLTLWLSSQLFYQLAEIQPLAQVKASVPLRDWFLPLVAFTLTYFLLNSWIITFAIALEKRLRPFIIWRDNIAWLSLNYFGGASVAALLVSYRNAVDLTYLAVILPLLAVLYFTYSVSMGRVSDANRHLAELNRLHMSTIETLAMAIDAKDQITHGHIRRVQAYAVSLAKKMGVTDEAHLKAIEAAALLHDMGKLAIPEYILNKPGPLTAAEFEKMKLHSSVGADILSAIDFPYPVVPIVRHHHESWDGSGYPDGLTGTAIPVGARILAVVDCFDALTSDRPYRPRLDDKEALRILLGRRGNMYDPLVVDTFLKVHAELAPTLSAYSSEPSFATLAEAAAVPSPSGSGTHPLDDIAASSEEMLTLFTLARDLTSRMSPAAVADVLLKHLRRLVPSSLCVLYLYDEDATDLVASHVSGETGENVYGTRIPLGERLSGWVGANRQSIRNSDPVLDFGDVARSMKPRLRSCLSTPLVSMDKLVGVLSMYGVTAGSFSEEHQRLLEIVGRQVAPVLQRSIDYSTSALMAARDPVRTVPRLHHAEEASTRQELLADLPIPSALIYVDVCDVRSIGLTHGLSVAEQGLRDVIQIVRANLRGTDLMLRQENEDLVVLLLNTDREAAGVIASRMQTSIQQAAIGSRKPRSVSMIVVAAPEDGGRIESLIEAARRRLSREGKSAPRNHRNPESIH
jgi:diguanylate cyclase (GGDEF)-like protein/putative nucleotidyltransferase with HDIG domain